MFNLLCSSTNQQLFKKNFCNQSSHHENYGQFNGSNHMPITKLTLFVVNKDEWYTKEGHSKSMKNATAVWQKAPLWSEQKNQARSLSHCWVTQVWKHQADRQLVSQSVENSINIILKKFCSNCLKAFSINLKAFLGLVLPNQCYHIVMQGIKVKFLHGAPPQSSTSLLWITIVVHDKCVYTAQVH